MTGQLLKNQLLYSILILGFTFAAQVNAKDHKESSAEKPGKERQALENPRIVVQENLQEVPEVTVTSGDETQSKPADIKVGDSLAQADNVEGPLVRFTPGSKTILGKTDIIMEAARFPLTYVQEHVPYLTKRNIIFFGRVELDASIYSSGILKEDSGFNIRRFRIGIAGLARFIPGWYYKLEVDLTDGQNSLSDAYLSRRSKKWGTFRIGNQKVAQTLSGQTSSLSTTFMERPLPVLAFTLDRRAGLGWDTHLRRLGANVTVFAGDPNNNIGSQGWAARGYFNPTRDRFQVLHIGASYLKLISDADARLKARPESHVTAIKLVDTGIRPGIDSHTALGLELAGSKGPVTFKSEYYITEWSRSNQFKNLRFNGWYAEASWFLTGELALYHDGKFIRPNIRKESGAWEVAFRASSVDLNDKDIHGGTEKNLAVAVNWYSNTHWRLMGNLIKVKAEDGPHGTQAPWIVQFRVQYYF